jgi:hypothetical protein
LRGRDLLLNARLQQLRFGQGQTQIGDIMDYWLRVFRPFEICP